MSAIPPLFATRLASPGVDGISRPLWFSRCHSDMFSLVCEMVHSCHGPTARVILLAIHLHHVRVSYRLTKANSVSSRVNVDSVVNDAFWCRGVENVDFETISQHYEKYSLHYKKFSQYYEKDYIFNSGVVLAILPFQINI